VLRTNGGLLYLVDLSDRFAHADPSLLPGNFLRLRAAGLGTVTGNRYMYMNRLRASEYGSLLAGVQVEMLVADLCWRSLTTLKAGSPVASRFQSLTLEDLARDGLNFVGRFA